LTLPAPGSYHWDIPGYKETVGGKADGSDLPITGPTAPPGLTLSVKQLTPLKISYIVKDHGKTESIGNQTLSADGKFFTDVSWSPGKETEKQTGIYISNNPPARRAPKMKNGLREAARLVLHHIAAKSTAVPSAYSPSQPGKAGPSPAPPLR
jgi:hypothetical protein